MQGGGAGPAAAPPAGPGGKDPDEELLKGFQGIFKVMKKMAEMKPELNEKFGPIKEQFKSAIVDVLKKDPKTVDEAAAGGEKEPTVTGNASPQEPGPTPPPPPDPTKVPV